jgi:hypothetical protein
VRIYRRVWQLYVAHILLFVAYTAQIAYISIARDTPQLIEEMQLLVDCQAKCQGRLSSGTSFGYSNSRAEGNSAVAGPVASVGVCRVACAGQGQLNEVRCVSAAEGTAEVAACAVCRAAVDTRDTIGSADSRRVEDNGVRCASRSTNVGAGPVRRGL